MPFPTLRRSLGTSPVTWDDFRAKYLDLYYPGHALEGTARKEAARNLFDRK
jgi:hypothetical protein